MLLSGLVLSGLLLSGLAGCGREEGPQPFPEEHVRPADDARTPPGLTTAERLGFRTNRPQDGGPAAAASGWTWKAPAGWVELPQNSMRVAGFQVGPGGAAEFTFTSLSGQGGGLAENVNRWRKQMSLDPLSPEEIANLPKRSLLGRPAVQVELEGTYVGMGDGPGKEGSRLLGQILELPMATLFLKLVGPEAVVAAERESFDRFAASLTFGAAAHAAGAGQGTGEMGAVDPPGLAWDVPPGWVEKPARPMRVVTLAPQDAKESECYVTVLTGTAGGVEANVNRWREQMGQPPLDTAAVAALERIPVLGQEAVLVRIGGHFTGMGDADVAGAVLLGLICERRSDTLFVKMTGPAAEVEPAEAGFIAFCKSLRE